MITGLFMWGAALLGLYWFIKWCIRRDEYRRIIGNSKQEMDYILGGRGER